jgi:subtilase family serine protease
MLLKTSFCRSFEFLLLAVLLMASLQVLCAQEIVTRDSATKSKPQQPRLERMLLLLQPSSTQQRELDALLSDQVTPGNIRFHTWLTPKQFADQFSNSPQDTETVAAWLRSRGMVVAPLPMSRAWIEFSGTVAQVEQAFQTKIQPVTTIEGTRYRLASAIQVPALIAPFVQGFVSLDGSLSTAAATQPVALTGTLSALIAQTSLAKAQALTPSLADSWLHLDSTAKDGVTGAGQSIGIPARSNVRAEDFAEFRKSFGLSATAAVEVVLTGDDDQFDPGRTSEEGAAILAASWASATAPDAQIVLVPAASTNATDGFDLALATAVDRSVANIVSIGYVNCETGMSTIHQAFYSALYREASAQGISIVAASGDSGAAACQVPGGTAPIFSGRAVNGLASTPWNTSVGAAAFSKDSTQLIAWGLVPAAEGVSDSPAYATGGGPSTIYPTPAWQSAIGQPGSDPGTTSAHHRYLPDISLPAAVDGVSNPGLAFCFAGEQAVNGCRLMSSGGSAASAAMFAGIGALLAEKYGPQGNLSPNLYLLHQAESSAGTKNTMTAFADISSGSAQLRCATGTPDCGEDNVIGFSASRGYDLATGLGSVNAQVLIKNWTTVQATGTAAVTVEMTNTTGVTYNPSANITLSAKVLSGSGGTVPTGTVQFYDSGSGADAGTPVTLASDGTASYIEEAQFTVGGHNVEAIYSGDSTYKSATSQPLVITIEPSATSLIVSPSTASPAAGSSVTVTGTLTSTNPGNASPTGTFTVNLNGVAQGSAKFATSTAGATIASVSVTAPAAGSAAVQGIYSGDTNYTESTSPSVTITVSKTATVTSIAATPSTITTGVPETFTVTVAPATTASGTVYTLTGTVSFYDGGTALLGTSLVSSNTAILTGITLTASAAHTITAVYSGDSTYNSSTSAPLLLAPILAPVTVVLTSSNSVLTPEQPVTLTATVTPVNTPPLTAEQHPSGYVLFYAGTTLISAQVPIVVGTGYSSVASTYVPHLPAGQYTVTAQYFGDPTYAPATSNSLSLQIEDFTIASTITNIDLTQGSSATVPYTVTSLGGLTGQIQITCAEQNAPTTGAINCQFTPSVIDGTGNTTLTITTTAGNVSRNESTPPTWPATGGGFALAFVGILLSPIGRRARILRRSRMHKFLVLLLLLAGFASTELGCSNTVAINPGTGGTPLGVATLKITAGALVNTVTETHNAYLTVNVQP